MEDLLEQEKEDLATSKSNKKRSSLWGKLWITKKKPLQNLHNHETYLLKNSAIKGYHIFKFRVLLKEKTMIVKSIARYIPIPSSLKWEVCNIPIISRKWHNVCQHFGFQALWKPENVLSRTFCSLKLPLENWILHCLCENVLEYPPNITKEF